MEHIEEVIERVRKGDRESYRNIVCAFQQEIFEYTYYMLRDRQEAEDAVQEIFLRAYDKIQSYEIGTSFSAWLYTMAYHYCLNQLRRKKRFRTLIPMLYTGYERSVADYVNDSMLSPELSHALSLLNPNERAVLLLRVLKEKSFEEIAMILDEKQTTIRKRYERTRKKLHASLSKKEGSLHEKKPISII